MKLPLIEALDLRPRPKNYLIFQPQEDEGFSSKVVQLWFGYGDYVNIDDFSMPLSVGNSSDTAIFEWNFPKAPECSW